MFSMQAVDSIPGIHPVESQRVKMGSSFKLWNKVK